MSIIPLNVLLNNKVLDIPSLLAKAGVSRPYEVQFMQKMVIPKVYDLKENELTFASTG